MYSYIGRKFIISKKFNRFLNKQFCVSIDFYVSHATFISVFTNCVLNVTQFPYIFYNRKFLLRPIDSMISFFREKFYHHHNKL